MKLPAILVLADGTVFHGTGIGRAGQASGEVVFNTAMSGYQEILTDPSYAQQMVTLTYPHIGNTGVNPEDEESADIRARGLIIRDLPALASNFRSTATLPEYLEERGIVAIAEVDTRRLTRHLREQGSQNGCILVGETPDVGAALAEAQAAPSLKGLDLAQVVTTAEPYPWHESVWALGSGHSVVDPAELPRHVVAYDFGVKRNILRMLVARGCRVTVVPAQTPAADVLALQPDGIFLSNGPGDPEPCAYAITAIQELLHAQIPMFGICLGHQLLALATGARSEKMKFGHHGANHPVQDLATGKVLITSQNHGFAVAEDSLPARVRPTHRSLFDQSLQGVELTDCPAFSFQGHPEAGPGPNDIGHLFDRFVALMEAN